MPLDCPAETPPKYEEPQLLILNISNSPGQYQHFLGFDEALLYINEATGVAAHDGLIRISAPLDIFRSARTGDSLFIFAPHLLTPFYALLARLRGIHVFHWLHEPAPLQFLASNLANHSKWSRLKILFLSLFYNPLSALLASHVVICSRYAISSLQCSLLGLFLALTCKPVHLCPLPYPSKLSSYSRRVKRKGLAVCGSLNTDKGADLLLRIAEWDPSLPINILCTSAAFKSNISLRRLAGFPSIHVSCKEIVDDSDIYSHISENSHIFLGYKAITQSGLLPIALALGTVPVVTRLPAFTLEFWDNPSLICVLPDRIDRAAEYLDSLNCVHGYDDESIPYFLDGQMKVVEFLSFVLNFSPSAAETISLAFRDRISSLFAHQIN